MNRINRRPIDTHGVEVTNTVYVIAPRSQQKEALLRLEEELEAASIPTRGLVVHAFGQDAVEIESVLTTTAIEGEQMDIVIQKLSSSDYISQASWSPSTTE